MVANYSVSDGEGGTASSTLTITVTGVNDAPVAVADAYATNEDTALVIPAPGVLTNDSDVDGDPLTAALVAGPANGTLSLNADGSFTYTPNANYNGTDSFTYKANDGTADGNTVTVNLTVNAVNDAPVAVADAYATNEDTALVIPAPGVLTNDSDVDGDPLTAALVAGPANGTLSLNADGSFTYTPNANYNGTDSFTYKANDGTADGNTVTVNLTVADANDAPVANDDAGTANEDNALTVDAASGLLANDTDVDAGASLAVSEVNGGAVNVGSQITLASGALLTVNADGSYSYDPNGQFEALRPGETDTDSFTYTTTDGTVSDTATVAITINGANEVPVAGDDLFGMTGNTPITLTAAQLLGNDSDPDGPAASLTIMGVSAGTNGTVVNNGDGTFTFTPATGFSGAATFTYTVEDADGGTDSGTVTLNVTDPVWYVNGATGSDVTGDGSYTNPFASLAPLSTGGSSDALDNANDTIFIYNAGTYTSSIVLEAGQDLIGDGHAFSVNGIAIGDNASNTTINHAGIGVTLSTDNTIYGVTLNGTAAGAVGVEDGGGSVGTFTMDESSITGMGKAVDIDQGGTLAVDLDVLSSASSTSEGVHLAGTASSGAGLLSGTFTASAGTISGAVGTAFKIGDYSTLGSGGDANIAYGGDLLGNAGRSVDIGFRTGGTIDFSGDITHTAAGQPGIVADGSTAGTVNFTGQSISISSGNIVGIQLSNNSSGATFNFAPAAGGTGLDINITSGYGFAVTGGTTVSVTGSGNSITSSTGQLIDWHDATIGAGGVNFASLTTTGTATLQNGEAVIHLSNVDGGTFNGGAVTIGGATSASIGHGIHIEGSSSAFNFASATIDNATGDGVRLGTNSGAVTFTTVNIDGVGGAGVNISSATSAVNINGGSIGATNDPAGDGIMISGGNAAVNIAASVTKTGVGGEVVDISNHSTGAISFTGAISSSGGGGGISLVNNSSGNIGFTGVVTLNTGTGTALNFTNTASTGANVTLSEGSLNIDTTSGTGINATSTTIGAGSLTITGANNSVASTTGRAINVDGVTANLTFHDVSVSGNGTTTGVFLKNTGGSGQFVVTGDGSVAGSGGTIKDIGGANLANATSAATTGTGIYLENVSNVSLSNMTFGSTLAGENLMTNFGIRGTNVNNFTLRDSQFLGSFGDTYANGMNNLYEGTIRFGAQGGDGTGNGLTGVGVFEGNVIGGGFNDNLSIFNNSTGTLNMTIRDSANDQAIFTHNGLSGNDGVLIETRGNGGAMGAGFNFDLLVDGVEFQGARGDNIQTVAASNTDQTITIQNSSFINSHPAIVSGGGGVTLSGGGNTSAYNVDYSVTNNTFKGAEGTALGVNYSGQNVNASGVILNNIIGTANGVFDSSQALGGSTNGGNGISVTSEKFLGAGSVTHAVRIEGNTVADINSGIAGISLTGGNQGGGSVRIEATVNNNTVTDAGDFQFAGFYAVVGGAALSGDTTQMGLNISNNNMMSGPAYGENAYYFDQISQDARFYFPGYVGSANGEFATPAGTASADLSNYLDNTKANNGTNGAFPSFPGGIVNAGMVVGVNGSAFVLPAPLMAAHTPDTGWEDGSSATGAVSATPSAAELAMLAEAAIGRWADAGASEDQLAAMREVEFDFTELNGLRLAESTEGLIVVDADAAGHGWFVDPTPYDDVEFEAGAPGIGQHYDLLSVLMHELGHQIGLDDQFGNENAGLMNGIATAGERTLPDALPQAAASEGAQHTMGWREAADTLDGSGGSVSELLAAFNLDTQVSGDGGFSSATSELSPTFAPVHRFDAPVDFVVVAEERVL